MPTTTDRADVPLEVLAALRGICAGLPESYEEPAWVGTRWRIRQRTVLHVFTAHPGSTGAFSRATELTEPAVVMTFRARAEEFDSLVGAGHPFFRAAWGTQVVGMIIEPDADWTEIKELLTESYRELAPRSLRASSREQRSKSSSCQANPCRRSPLRARLQPVEPERIDA